MKNIIKCFSVKQIKVFTAKQADNSSR